MRHCRKCGSLYVRERRISVLEVRILPLIALRHFECLSCCRAFYGFGAGNLPVNQGLRVPAAKPGSGFKENDGEQTFEHLVKELRAAERRMRQQGYS